MGINKTKHTTQHKKNSFTSLSSPVPLPSSSTKSQLTWLTPQLLPTSSRSLPILRTRLPSMKHAHPRKRRKKLRPGSLRLWLMESSPRRRVLLVFKPLPKPKLNTRSTAKRTGEESLDDYYTNVRYASWSYDQHAYSCEYLTS